MKKNFKYLILPFLTIVFIYFIVTGSSLKEQKTKKMGKEAEPKIEVSVNGLLNKMTLEEKLEMLGGTGFATKPIPRLGIPELKMSDGPLGVRWEKSTAFPAGIAMSATWDTSLIHKVGEAIGEETKGHGRDVILGPCVNIARIPQGGRNFESFGEDPYLSARMGVSYIEGVQSKNVAATVKHFAVNNQEYERMFVNVNVDERTLNEIYLPAFKAAVEEADVLCVMSAYNRLNNHFCSENDYLLKTKLKDDWNFKGLVMSDWGAVHSSLPTAKGGLDLEMPNGQYLNKKSLMNAINDGEISEQVINDKVKRILTVMFKLGLFDHTNTANPSLINTTEHKNIAYQSALESIVLLKNDKNILPLKVNNIKSLAVIGPNAAVARTGGGGSSRVTPVYSVSPLQALKTKLGKNIKINYAEGIKLDGDANFIDGKFLFQPDKKNNGLLGEYFDNKELKGSPSFSRVDKEINFEWGPGAPKPGFKINNFSIRWTGYIKPDKSGEYSIDVQSDDGIRFYFEDKLVIDDWTNHGVESHSFNANLESGKLYKIKIEYYEDSGDAVAKLGWQAPNNNLINQAIETAKKSDAVLLFVGTSEHFESEGKDRQGLELPNDQDKLINEIAKVNKNLIVVLTTGSPVLMSNWINNVNGIVETWFNGSEGGNAIADVLLGNYNPSGKLTMTFPKEWKNCSAYSTYKKEDSVSNYSDGIFVGYRYFDKEKIQPLFPFGFGLSYTTFKYKNISVEKDQNGEFNIKFELINSGKVKGSEIVQLYIGKENSKIERAEKELKKFKRVTLNPGEKKSVEFKISKNILAYYDVNIHNWKIEPGEYEIKIGSSSRDIKLAKNILVE